MLSSLRSVLRSNAAARQNEEIFSLILGKSCEFGLVFGGQAAGISGLLKSFREVALCTLGIACPIDSLWQPSESSHILHEQCNFGKLSSVTVHSCESGLVFGGQAAGLSGLLKSFRELALSSLGIACPIDKIRQTSESSHILHESCNYGKLSSVAVHSYEFVLVFGGQAAGCSGLVKSFREVALSSLGLGELG